MKLNEIAKEIRDLLIKRQEELGLTFEEERHIYTMVGRSDWPSVSKVIKLFYKGFPTEEAAYKKAKGDVIRQQELIKEWDEIGRYSANLGSRVHFVLEENTIKRNGSYKETRKPNFDCDLSQRIKSDKMISAGMKYLDLLEKRELVLIDTEVVLGDPDFGYTGQPDKVWVTYNKSKDGFGLLITDWKTNKPKSFKENDFTEKMYHPFDFLPSTALGHYYVQLPLYGKLLIKMLQGTKYQDIKLLGCIIAHLREDAQFEEFRVPKRVIDTVIDMDVKKYLGKNLK